MAEAIAGIDPKTRRCRFIAADKAENWEECHVIGLIVVPTTFERARASWGEVIDDVYALTEPAKVECAACARDAARYHFLRTRDLDTIVAGGVFAGLTPENVVLNGDELDRAVDVAMKKAAQK